MALKKCFSTLGCTDASLETVLGLCRKYGFDAVEIRGVGGELNNGKIPDFQPDRIAEAARKMQSAGVRAQVLGTSCAFHKTENAAQVPEEGAAAARIAKALGCPYLRVFGNRALPDAKTAVRNVSDGIARLCGAAAEAGVGVLLEVHGDFNREETLAPVCENLAGFPNFGLIWDVCHTDGPYGDGWEAFLDRFYPRIRHVHVKDRRRSDGALCLCGDGDIPLRPILGALDARGYDGCVSLEWERRWHPELAPLEEAMPSFLSLFEN